MPHWYVLLTKDIEKQMTGLKGHILAAATGGMLLRTYYPKILPCITYKDIKINKNTQELKVVIVTHQ